MEGHLTYFIITNDATHLSSPVGAHMHDGTRSATWFPGPCPSLPASLKPPCSIYTRDFIVRNNLVRRVP